MMKKIYGLILFMIAGAMVSIAQPTLTQANFVHNIGDSTHYFLADTNTTTLNPTIGANVVFDYTTVKSIQLDQTDLYLDPAGTPGAADFPTADYAEKTNLADTNYIYSQSDNDSLFTIGFIADISGFGTVTAEYNNDAEAVMRFPFNYGDNYVDNYSGVFSTLYLGVIPVSTPAAGNVSVNADAWGRLELPYSVSFDSVLRVTRIEHVVTDPIVIPPPASTTIDPLTIDAIVVSYYKPSESKSPIMSFIEGSYSQNGSIVASNKTIISQYPLVVGIEEHDLAKSVSLYPNPVSKGNSTLSFNMEATADAQIQLMNNLGQKVKDVYRGKLNTGLNTFNLETETLSSGVYFVNILLEDGKITKKLIVE